MTFCSSLLIFKSYLVVEPRGYFAAQGRKTSEPFRRLLDDQKGRADELRVGEPAPAHGCLIGECSDRFQTALDCHQPKLARELVRVKRRKAALAPLVQKKEAGRAHFRERRRLRLPVHQERNQIVARRAHTRVLVIDYAQPVASIHDQVGRVIITMTEEARALGQLRRNVVELGLQFRRRAVRELLLAQAAEKVFEKEAKLPGQLRFVEGKAAGD